MDVFLENRLCLKQVCASVECDIFERLLRVGRETADEGLMVSEDTLIEIVRSDGRNSCWTIT